MIFLVNENERIEYRVKIKWENLVSFHDNCFYFLVIFTLFLRYLGVFFFIGLNIIWWFCWILEGNWQYRFFVFSIKVSAGWDFSVFVLIMLTILYGGKKGEEIVKCNQRNGLKFDFTVWILFCEFLCLVAFRLIAECWFLFFFLDICNILIIMEWSFDITLKYNFHYSYCFEWNIKVL